MVQDFDEPSIYHDKKKMHFTINYSANVRRGCSFFILLVFYL